VACLLGPATHAFAFQEAPPRPQQPIVFGLQYDTSRQGQVVVTNVYPDSPAAKAGLRVGDIINAVENQPVRTGRELTRSLTGRQTGGRISLQVMRSGRPTTMDIIADGSVPVLANSSTALTVDQRAFGWTIRPADGQVVLAEVAGGSVASRLGLRAGDVIVAVDGVEVRSAREFNDMMSKLMAERPGETVPVTVLRGEERSVVSLQLPTTQAATPPKPAVAPPAVPEDRKDTGRAFGMVLDTTAGGLVITDIAPGSPAQRAGLAPGDTVLKIGSANVDTYTGLLRAFDLIKPAPEVKISFARDGEPRETTLVIGPPRAVAADEDLEKLRSDASHIVVGGVKAIYSFEQTTPDWTMSHRLAEVEVAEVEKGEGIEPGQLIYVRYSVQSDPAGAAAKTPYPNVRSTFHLFLKRAADGGYDLLLPGGAQIVDGQPAAETADVPAPTEPAVPVVPAKPPVAAVPAVPTVTGANPVVTPAPLAPAAGRGIEGTVVLAEVPQPGIQVDLWDAAGLAATTTTNSKGAFAFNVAPGRYMVSARGTVGTLIRVTPPVPVFVPSTAAARVPLKIPLR
jgi:S1-C subfamily serine protease